MPRSKNRILRIMEDGEYMTIQWVRANGEVVIGGFKLKAWHKPPADAAEELHRILSHPPQSMYGTKRGRAK